MIVSTKKVQQLIKDNEKYIEKRTREITSNLNEKSRNKTMTKSKGMRTSVRQQTEQSLYLETREEEGQHTSKGIKIEKKKNQQKIQQEKAEVDQKLN